MIQTLSHFTSENLFAATSVLLDKLGIQFDREIAEPIPVADLFDGPIPKYLDEVLKCIKATYFIGVVNDLSLQGAKSEDSLEEITDTIEHGGKYDGMFVFACDVDPDANLTRSAAAALTRGFNRIASANPVIFIIRQGDFLSLATCERLEYSQQWRQGNGAKVGKVCILRNVNCRNPHRGHLDILESLCEKFSTFETLYKHWMEVFSSELLTKKFYSELSDWYAWAVKVAKFPNDLNTKEDDDKFNYESCIRLITRLIFIWFLKQKNLVPEEFFDENYIRENLIENFNPHDKDNILFKPSESKYYRLILQNLFFAMLNCPIVAEGKNVANNRRFRARVTDYHLNHDYNVNNLMRYEREFMTGGAKKFVHLANSSVPFLNGGLFDCLDDKPSGLYYDGFSECGKSLEQLYLPDYLFFGDEVGRSIDLSEWYDDNKKRCVSARGIIDILKRYSFTIEENTPLDQEVSLDPELLGKVFENLLAAFNPETKTSARKQTGSFYTPREIVQYMVDESLVAHLKRTCGDELEPEYRSLLSYTTEETTLTKEQRKAIMHSLYNCRVLDPACGSGAFPMGILQQMVHILRQLDPTNEMWKDFMIDLAIEQSKVAFAEDEEEERKARLADIEEAFNQNINDPDYARKLYLIEHCIFGVDIQPIAVQISKLRFFISLVVDQKPTDDATHNFGIRPLPNLESKFVAANTLIPIQYDGSLVESAPEVRKNKGRLKELNHKVFLAKRNIDKLRLKDEIKSTRHALAQAIENTGFLGHSEAELLAGWDMFDQNSSSSYFDAEWMFGIKEGFDVVIANPPYIKEYVSRQAFDGFREISPYYMGKMDLWYGFACHGIDLLATNGVLCFIAQNNWTTSAGAKKMRNKIISDTRILQMLDFNTYMIFESADIQTMIMLFEKNKVTDNYVFDYRILKDGANKEDMLALLKRQKRNTMFRFHKFTRAKFVNKNITFSDNDAIFEKIAWNKVYLQKNEVAQGIVFPQDFLDKKGVNKLNGKFPVGTGIFGLSDTEYRSMSLNEFERKLIKPYFTTEQINRYYTLPYNTKWLIYTDSSFKSPNSMDNYPHIKAHLDQFVDIFTSDNRPYGLHRSRKEMFFKGEKIISLRKCVGQPCFSYSDFDCYVTQTFFSIKTSRWNMKFLIGILNSKLVSFWLRHKGKMQGNNYQIDKEPLQSIPLPNNIQEQELPIICLVNKIISAKANNPSADTTQFELQIDILVYHLYDLTYNEVLIVDPETPISREEYENYKAE